MSGLSRTPGKRVYGESRNEGSNPSLSAKLKRPRMGPFLFGEVRSVDEASGSTSDTQCVSRRTLRPAAQRSRALARDAGIAARRDRHNPSLSAKKCGPCGRFFDLAPHHR